MNIPSKKQKNPGAMGDAPMKAMPPKIYPIQALPEFVQQVAEKFWKENNITLSDVMKASICFTFHDGIYARDQMPTSLFVHESVHYVRQGSGTDAEVAKQWWLRWATEPEFRYQEELLAYREQYKYTLRHVNKAVAFEHVKAFAEALSGPIYGNMVSYMKALNDIIAK